MVTAIGGLQHFYKSAVTSGDVVMEEVPMSRCANLIILIFLNGEKLPNDHNFVGCLFQLLKNKFVRLLNFITKTLSLLIYLLIYIF